MSEADRLRTRWVELNAGIPAEIREKWWHEIENHYGESSVRHYHTLVHLEDMFQHFDLCKEKLNALNEVAYAIFFHDLVYDPKSSSENEEKSIERFQKFALDAGIPEDSSLYKNVTHLISLTTTHLTKEHIQPDVFGEEDQHYFLDFDMAVLGSKSEHYVNYAQKIGQEYSFLSRKEYNLLRAKVLTSFLQIPKIFSTKHFYDKYETQARTNIQREIDQLASTSDDPKR